MKNLFLKAFIVFIFICGVIILATQKKKNVISVKSNTEMRYAEPDIDGSK